MVGAIRKNDRQHLVTVGAIPWAMTWPDAQPLFYSRRWAETWISSACISIPGTGEVDQALKALAVYQDWQTHGDRGDVPAELFGGRAGPVHPTFKTACGWISLLGKTVAEYRQHRKDIGEALMLDWLEYCAKQKMR